jgi:outer membrane receptor protein involved in Fe transport
VQNLPGVARSSFGSGQLIVWGSSPRETRVNVDGVEIPTLYHVGGLRSTVNSDLVRSIDLSPGAFGADYGRGLGGLVRIELGAIPKDGVHGYVASDAMTPPGSSRWPSPRAFGWRSRGRYSYLDRLAKAGRLRRRRGLRPHPRYDDYQARATLALRQDEELSATFLASDDHLRRAIPLRRSPEVRSQNTDLSWEAALPPLHPPDARRGQRRRHAVDRLRRRRDESFFGQDADHRHPDSLAVRAPRHLPAPGRRLDDAGPRARLPGPLRRADPTRLAHPPRPAKGTSPSSATRPETRSPTTAGTS